MWRYEQATGKLYRGDVDLIGTGYSGQPPRVNDTSAEAIRDVGPCPRGRYTVGQAHPDGDLGPVVMNLTPVAPFDALGRTDLRIHGDSLKRPGYASHGCIVLGRAIRDRMADAVADGDNLLEVF